ncbi:DUF3558 family protein [Nocardia cyriacigeorgica]|nr:DUF3558 family protein [Nocardia cyriacigeorgica]
MINRRVLHSPRCTLAPGAAGLSIQLTRATARTPSTITPPPEEPALTGHTLRQLAIAAWAIVTPAVTGCSGADDNSSPVPAASAADTGTATAPATPSMSARLGVDLCTLVTPEEIPNALGRDGVVPRRTADDKDGRVVAESCDWGSETEGLVSVAWMEAPIPPWRENAHSIAFTEAIGLRTTVNDWEGRFCAVFAERPDTNLGVTITPSEEYMAAHPATPGDDICDRNKATIIALFQRAQPS